MRDWLFLFGKIFLNLLVDLLLNLWPGGEAVKVEHEGGRGGGEAVREQGEADHGDVLEGQGGPGQEVGEEVVLVISDGALLHGGVQGQHCLVTEGDGLGVEFVLGRHQPPPLGSGDKLVERQRELEVTREPE